MQRIAKVFWMFCAIHLLLSIKYIQHGIARDLPGRLRLTYKIKYKHGMGEDRVAYSKL